AGVELAGRRLEVIEGRIAIERGNLGVLFQSRSITLGAASARLGPGNIGALDDSPAHAPALRTNGLRGHCLHYRSDAGKVTAVPEAMLYYNLSVSSRAAK